MTEYCPNCFGTLDALHSCEDEFSVSRSKDHGAREWNSNQALGSFIIFAPLAGVLLDVITPLPSSLVHSVAISILGSALAAAIWVAITYQGQKSFRFYFFNIKNFIYTPNLLKIFGSQGKSKATTTWIAMIVLSAALQIVLFTPGNAAYLSNRVTAKIDEASGANLSVDCPTMKLYFYNKRVECRVKTGLFGISVPARAKLSPLWGSSQIKVSLF